jgi:hypothetical protein
MQVATVEDVYRLRPSSTVSAIRKRSVSLGIGPSYLACDFVFSTTCETSVSGFSRAKAALDKAIM